MGSIIISSEEKDSFSRISNNFIDYYMADANGEFVKVYMYLLRLFTGNRPVSISGIADHLSCTEADVERAFKYWISKDVIKVTYGPDGAFAGLVLATLSAPSKTLNSDLGFLGSLKKEVIEKDSIELIAESVEEETAAPKAASQTKPAEVYKEPTPAMILTRMEDPYFHDLTYEAAAYFKRELTQEDLRLLIHIYDELGFSFDLCEYLLEYCADIGKVKVSYVRKVAQNWHANQLMTREDATYYTMRFFTIYSQVLLELGIKDHDPTPVEKEYIDRWAKEFGFEDSIIIEACRRAVLAKGANLNYVNGIMVNWHKANVKNLTDVIALDKQHEATLAASRAPQTVARKKPSISDIQQSDMSAELDFIERRSMPNKKRDD